MCFIISAHTVTTKSELESARKKKYEEIVVKGKLANDLKKSKRIAYASAATLAIVTAAIIAIPFTGGGSLVAAEAIATGAVVHGFIAGGSTAATATAAGLTGIEISTIIIAASLGISLIVALFKDYEEISFSDGTLTLRKKQ